MNKKVWPALIQIVLGAVLLSACAPNYYNNRLTTLAYDRAQRPASIQVSDPQLYKRESLLNERRDETEYLDDLLAKSRTIEFTPELARDIESVAALSAQLGISFDPAAKIKFERSRELSDLEQQIAATKLQMQLAQLRRDLELTQSSLASQTTPSAGNSSTTTTTSTTPTATALTAVAAPGLADAKEITTRLETLVSKLGERLDKASVAPRQSSVGSSPRELFQDRQAYRRELQSARNSTALDELHDFEANSLFRFQFRATVLPAKPDDADSELGVLQMRLERPRLDLANEADREYLRMLYLEWLDHASHRLNEVIDEDTVRPDPALLQIGAEGKYFSLLSIVVPRNDKETDCGLRFVLGDLDAQSKCMVVRAAVPPIPFDDIPEDTLRTSERAKTGTSSSLNAQVKTLADAVRQETRGSGSDVCTKLSAVPNWQTLLTAFRGAGATSSQLQRASNALIAQVNRLSSDAVGNLNDVIVNIASFLRVVEVMQRTGIAKRCGIPPPILKELEVPTGFAKALFQKAGQRDPTPNAPDRDAAHPKKESVEVSSADSSVTATPRKANNDLLIARGRISTYAVSPVLLGQRISSVARAADALQLAASLAASVPASGVGGNLGVGYMRSVTGKVDTIERIPLVIGYSGYTSNAQAPRASGFGWLLGPRVVLDSEKKALALEHNLAPYDLTADISMPGWWPYVDFHVQSAWAPNWRKNPGHVLPDDTGAQPDIRLKMRHSRGDLDGITTLVLQGQSGPRVQTASIGNVEPRKVSDCVSAVTFLVRGTNIWRARDAYLQGQPGQSIYVLPDMAGISVKFNIDKLPAASGSGLLVVATPDGLTSTTITIAGDRSTNCAPQPPEGEGPKVATVYPGGVYACESGIRLVVRGKNFKGAKVYLGPMPGHGLDKKDPPIISDEERQIEVYFDGPIGTKGGTMPALPLIISTDKGAATKDVLVERDNCAAPTTTSKTASLTAMPNGTLNLCATEIVVFAAGGDASKIDGASIALLNPKINMAAQSIRILPQAGAAEVSFQGLPKNTLVEGFASSARVNATNGERLVASSDLRVVCGMPSKAATQ